MGTTNFGVSGWRPAVVGPAPSHSRKDHVADADTTIGDVAVAGERRVLIFNGPGVTGELLEGGEIMMDILSTLIADSGEGIDENEARRRLLAVNGLSTNSPFGLEDAIALCGNFSLTPSSEDEESRLPSLQASGSLNMSFAILLLPKRVPSASSSESVNLRENSFLRTIFSVCMCAVGLATSFRQ